MIGDWLGSSDGGFEADGGGAAVEDGVDAVVEVFEDVGGGGGAGAAEAVGAGGGDGDAGGFDEGEGDGVGGHADAYEGAPGGDVVGDACGARQEEGERAGPEGGDEAFGLWRDDGDLIEHGAVADVDDDGVPAGALFGGEDAGYGVWRRGRWLRGRRRFRWGRLRCRRCGGFRRPGDVFAECW